MIITVEPGQTLFDIAIQHYEGIEGVFVILNDNPDAVPDIDTILSAGTKLNIYPEKKIVNLIAARPEPAVMKAHKTEVLSYGQSLFDMAIQEYGSIEGLFAILADNNLSVSSVPDSGTRLKINTISPVSRKIRDYFSQAGIKINTGEATSANGRPQGVGYWIIELDNIVQ